jgi:O-antigen ligase
VPLARIERWFLRIGLFLLPVAYWWDTYDRYVLPKLLVARVLVIGLLILFVARSMATRTLVLKRTALDVPLAVFLISALASTLVAENQNVAIFGIYSRYDGLLTILTYAGLFWLSVQAIDGPGDAKAMHRVLLASGYVVAAIAILKSASESATAGTLIQASGTLGQQNVLGAFLVMLIPLAYRELVEARTWSPRILAINALAMLGIALFLTLSRSAWLGAAVALIVVVAGSRRRINRTAVVGAAALLLILGAVGAALSLAGGSQLERSIAARATSVFDLSAWGPRPAIWRDSLHVIASRPLLGYGPDNFGLVYPRFQAASLGTVQVDKAHSETLQVAATQGLVGAAAYLLVLGAFVRAFWRGRQLPGAVPVFAAWVGYQVTLQLNFSALAASFPFWIFAAAAMESWGATRLTSTRSLGTSSWVLAAGGTIIAGLAVLGVLSTLPLYLADSHLLRAVNADYGRRPEDARAEAVEARRLAPAESVYAVEVGNLAFERGDWAGARVAYGDAARLGTYNPVVYRNLALADRDLGLRSEGMAAARKAVELDRFDPVNQALLAQFEVGAP